MCWCGVGKKLHGATTQLLQSLGIFLVSQELANDIPVRGRSKGLKSVFLSVECSGAIRRSRLDYCYNTEIKFVWRTRRIYWIDKFDSFDE